MVNYSTIHINFRFKEDKEIKPSEKFEMKYARGVAVLAVRNIAKSDAALYICKARNELGQTETKCKLIVEEALQKKAAKAPEKEEPREKEGIIQCITVQLVV